MVAEVPSLNIVQFTGCLNCYTKDVQENHRHQYPCHEPIVCRSPEDVCKDATLAEKEKKLSMEYLEGSLTKENISVVENQIQNIDCSRSFNGKSKSISELMYWKARDFICQTPVMRKKILLRTTSVSRHLYICQVRWIFSEKKLIFVQRKFFEG